MTARSVSVIVPAYRAERTLDACLASLLDQRYDGRFEVVVVASADEESRLPPPPEAPRIRVLAHTPRLSAAVARNRGVDASSGELLAFTDADVIADPDWLTELVGASEGRFCVGGAVVNGTPESGPGTVEYWVEFLDLHPSRPPATAWHGATCNLLVPRVLWDEVGPWPADLTGGEDTLMTAALRKRGLFRFAPTACVTHQNRTRWREVVRHQFEAGLFTARIGRIGPYKLRPLVRYSALAPLAAAARIASVCARVVAWDRASRRRLPSLFPAVVVTLAAWATGLAREGLKLDLGRALTRPKRSRKMPEVGPRTDVDPGA